MSHHNQSADDAAPAPRESVSQDQIEVHWQHPRHALENPVLLIWPNPLRENWAAEVLDGNRAKVVCRQVLFREETETDNDDGAIQKRAEPVQPHDEIPQYVETALLDYDSEYGPVDSVLNPVNEPDDEPPADPQVTLEEYFDRKSSVTTALADSASSDEEEEERPMVDNLLCGGRQSIAIRRNP